MNHKLNCLSHWYPKLAAAGVPVPRTEIVRTDVELRKVLDGAMPAGYEAFIDELSAAADRIGYPAFLRTGQGSGKHQWDRTCCLKSADDIRNHVAALAEWSECVDFLGLPYDVWCVREMLPVTPIGVCRRYGDMPVVKEFRAFVRDGEVKCIHPYWPLDSLIEGDIRLYEIAGEKAPADWYERLCDAPLHTLRTLASLAGQTVGGAWSVDMLETKRGWFVTDMALASESFHWSECSNTTKQE